MLDMTSLINTCLILYFLDSIFIKIIKPIIWKVWNFVLKMAGDANNKKPTGGSENNHPEGSPNNNNNDDSINTTNSSKPKKRKSYVPMSELSAEDQEKRRASNRKKGDAKKLKKQRELEQLKELSEDEKNALIEKLNNTKAKNAARSAKFRNKTNYKTPYNPDQKKAYYEENKERILLDRAQYRKTHKQENAEYQSRYRKDNSELIRDKNLLYRELNRDKLNAQSKENY